MKLCARENVFLSHAMSENPAPVPMTHASTRASAARWILLALAILLLAGAAGFWFGDVPNRYRAAEAMKTGRLALLKSDHIGALAAFREAALLRPGDEEIAARYEQTQAAWYEFTDNQLDHLDFKAAYLAWHALPDADALLTEPLLGRYRARGKGIDGQARKAVQADLEVVTAHIDAAEFDQAYAALKALEPFQALVPEVAERRQAAEAAQLAVAMAAAEDALKAEKFDDAREILKGAVKVGGGNVDYAKLVAVIGETEVRAWLRDARKAVGESKFKEARELLDKAAAKSLLADEVANAREAVLKSARAQASYALAVAISASDRAQVEGVLAEAEAYAEWKKVPVDDLLKPANVTAFLETLKAFDLGKERQSQYVDRLDIPLVLWARQNFQDQTGVQEFLRDGFTEWSRFVASHQMPATALYLDEQAEQYGATVDAAWRKETQARVPESVGVTIAVRDPAPDKDAPGKLNAEATAALKAMLAKKLKGWPKVVEFDEKKPATVVLQGRYDGFYFQDYPTTTEKFVRYQSGTEQVPNQRRQDIVAEHNDLMDRYNNVQQQLDSKIQYVDSVNNNPYATDWDRSQLVYKNIEIASDRNLLARWRAEIAELRRQGDQLPQTLSEPVYDNERYFVIEHSYNCTGTWVVDAELHGPAVEVATFVAGAEFNTTEVKGDASKGVPVKSAASLPKAKLLTGIARDIVKKVEEEDEIVDRLPDMTVTAFANFHTTNKSNAPTQTEQFLGLLYAWDRVGGVTSHRINLLQAARQNLNLPPLGSGKN